MSQDHAYALPAGYMLEEYRIERMLGSGGFGITIWRMTCTWIRRWLLRKL